MGIVKSVRGPGGGGFVLENQRIGPRNRVSDSQQGIERAGIHQQSGPTPLMAATIFPRTVGASSASRPGIILPDVSEFWKIDGLRSDHIFPYDLW
jgi:hypothetical protein